MTIVPKSGRLKSVPGCRGRLPARGAGRSGALGPGEGEGRRLTAQPQPARGRLGGTGGGRERAGGHREGDCRRNIRRLTGGNVAGGRDPRRGGREWLRGSPQASSERRCGNVQVRRNALVHLLGLNFNVG